MKIAIVANRSWYLYNFRRTLIETLRREGHEIVTVGARDAHTERLREVSGAHESVDFSGAGTRPWRELATVSALRKAFLRHRVEVVLSYTPKGNIYSAMALLGLRAALVTNVSGLGRSATLRQPLKALVSQLYRYTLGRAHWVFFQNEEDRNAFIAGGLVAEGKSSRLPGSGVDLLYFRPSLDPTTRTAQDGLQFLFMARLLWDKGLGEFVEAARTVRGRHPLTRFRVLGPIDPPHRAAVPRATVAGWQEEGIIEYLGTADDVRLLLQACDCLVLPSVYREGVPRSLLEAAAMARPVIACDSVGCRDAVDHDRSGFLCRPRDAADLARKILCLIELSPEQRRAMGERGRAKMEREFDERLVLDEYLRCLRGLQHDPRAG